MKKWLSEILNDIRAGKNIDAYVTVLLSFILAVLSLLGKLPLEILGAALLTCLSWLVLSMLSIRRERTTRPRASDFFSENYVYNSDDFEASFRSARDVHIIGMGQNRMITAYGAQIQRILAAGGKVQFILTEPDGVAAEMAIKRGSSSGRVDVFRQEHWGALERLSSCAQEPTSRGSLTVKLIDLLPSHTMYGFDLFDSAKAKIFVWITPFKEPSEKRPGFMLTVSQDPTWAGFFQRQFEKLWNWEEARVYDLHPRAKAGRRTRQGKKDATEDD